MRSILLACLLFVCGVAVAQDQPAPQAPFQAVPYGRPYYAPHYEWRPRQDYLIVPTQPGVVVRPYCYYPQPRGIWGIGPFPLGFYW